MAKREKEKETIAQRQQQEKAKLKKVIKAAKKKSIDMDED
jgi:hypothetical protein